MPAAVVRGDCRQLLPKAGKFRFIFADPPFNIGQEYNGYDDNRDAIEFEAFTAEWIAAAWGALLPNGLLALHGPDALIPLYFDAMRRHKMTKVAWINWHYRFGNCSRRNWIDARCHCLIVGRAKTGHVWNPDAVLVDSDRVSYHDKRIDETENGGRRVPGTVWGVPSDGEFWGRVQGTSAERRPDHPNQLPEVYLQRLLAAYTNVGDRVADPFGGSGTTAVVADAMGRYCWTSDVSEFNCRSIRDRIIKGAVRVPRIQQGA